MSEFSGIALSMAKREAEIESEKLLSPVLAWEGDEASQEARDRRRKAAEESFEFFDKTYFPNEAYSDGFSEPCEFHSFLTTLWASAGVHVVLGPRKHGKTATSKKHFAWLVLTGRVLFGATASATLSTSRNILSDIVDIINMDRVKYDFRPTFLEDNADQITFKVAEKRSVRRIIAISEGRSARGATMGFTRPEFILFDDLETRQSPLSRDASTARIKIIQEAYQSMNSTGSIVVLGNNFDERCAYNILKKEQEDGLLPAHWHVYSIPAWSEHKYVLSVEARNGSIRLTQRFKFPKGSLWASRYIAHSEDDLRLRLKVSDESEWQGDFQQNPVPPDGFLFQRRYDIAYEDKDLPSDARGVVYVDPNLSLKSKGDYTCIIEYLYSPSTEYYYIANLVLKSFSDSNDLLKQTFGMKSPRVVAVGMDGHVSQESTWRNNIRNFTRLNGLPSSPVQFCRYKVDEVAKNFQLVWNSGKVLISRRLLDTADGRRFLEQLYAFAGKRANRHDDGPDAAICVNELIHERHIVRRKSANKGVSIIKESTF